MHTKKKTTLTTPQPKRAYHTPRLKTLGSVKTITLKTGSAVDGFGTFA